MVSAGSEQRDGGREPNAKGWTRDPRSSYREDTELEVNSKTNGGGRGRMWRRSLKWPQLQKEDERRAGCAWGWDREKQEAVVFHFPG